MPYGTVNADVIQTSTSGGILGAGNASAMKNRIINGAMVINQRAFSGSATAGAYTLDRWAANTTQSSKYTVAQSSTAPTGFSNSLLVTSSSAYSVTSGDYFNIYQPIEGYNFADLGWGTASAKAVTISFQVYSSLTGTFGGALVNAAQSRSYPFSYTVSSANTWTTITVNIAGDTSGTWVGATNGVGVYVIFGLGTGSTYSGTANTWASAAYYAPTGAVSVVGTNGATFYITGVQLEVGSSATGFEYVNYQTSLANCQRYAIRFGGDQVYELVGQALIESSTSSLLFMPLPVFMRSSPSVSFSTLRIVELNGAAVAVTGVSTKGSESGNKVAFLNPVAASGLTTGRTGWISANNSTSAYLLLSAEL